MNKTIKFFIDVADHGKRVDVFLTKKIAQFTRSYIKKLIGNRCLTINSKIIKSPSKIIRSNDEIQINLIEKNDYKLEPQKINLDILYEDPDLLIINKPKWMVVHPGAGNYNNTLVNGLIYKYKKQLSNISGNLRPGIVHRIDKETSGLLVVAKNNLSHSKLAKQFSDHTIQRKYHCLIWGVVRPLNGRIETLISRSKKNRKLMAVSDFNGKKAITNYKTLKVFNLKDIPKISLIECELETGRTHQIRVHMKYKRTSLLGDNQYGKKNIQFKKINNEFLNKFSKLKGQALHAITLEFTHPTSNKRMTFNSEISAEFREIVDFLNNLSG